MTHDILVVDDAKDNLMVLRELLEFHGYGVRTATSVPDALRKIAQATPDLALIDLWLGSDPRGGIEILKAMRDQCPMSPAIMISAHVNVERAVHAMELGAFTFLEKPMNVRQIREVVRRGLEYRAQLRESITMRSGEVSDHCLVGESSAVGRLRKKIEKVASTNARALFIGGPGSGREEAARYLHLCSPRAERPFFCVTAASARDGAGEAEGDYWPPVEVLRCAHGGTLLIDEVEKLPQKLQPRLRHLLTSRLGPVDKGGENRIDVRITAAADSNLEQRIQSGSFARALYDRLAVIEFWIPPLVERIADIPALVERIARKRAEDRGLPTPSFTAEAVQALQQYEWPGNIRQLQNIVQEAVDLGSGDVPAMIDVCDLPDHFRMAAGMGLRRDFDMSALAEMPVKEARTIFERQYFLNLIEQTRANMPRIAEMAGMERSALYRKLNSIGIGPDTLARYRVEPSAAKTGSDSPAAGQEQDVREPENSP